MVSLILVKLRVNIYNDDGIRVYKNVNGNETKYYLDGSLIQTEITNFGGIERRIDYIYDEAGSIYGFSVDGVDYYYVKNLQGDITGIIDKSGNLLVEYVYTAYGVPTVSFPSSSFGAGVMVGNSASTGLYRFNLYDSFDNWYIKIMEW